MDPGKIIQYVLHRRVHYLVRNGTYLEDVKGNITGFIIDHEFSKLENGEELLRTVDECDGTHSIKTSDEKEVLPIYQRAFFHEEAGLIKDDEMLEYPFDHAEHITLRMIRKKKGTLNKGEEVDIIIKTAEATL